MKTSLIFNCALIIFLFTACGKPEPKPIAEEESAPVNTPLQNGLPQNFKSINGFMYASVSTQTNFGGLTGNIRTAASFGDPGRNILGGFNHYQNFETEQIGNISVGSVSFLDRNLNEFQDEPFVSYSQNTNLSNFNYGVAYWTVEGNGSFKPLSISLPRGFPKILSGIGTYSISRTHDFLLNTSHFGSNYDSVCVLMFGSGGISLRKAIAYPETSMIFTSAEIAAFYKTQTFASLQIMTFNYANITIESKTYVFELSDKVSGSLNILP